MNRFLKVAVNAIECDMGGGHNTPHLIDVLNLPHNMCVYCDANVKSRNVDELIPITAGGSMQDVSTGWSLEVSSVLMSFPTKGQSVLPDTLMSTVPPSSCLEMPMSSFKLPGRSSGSIFARSKRKQMPLLTDSFNL